MTSATTKIFCPKCEKDTDHIPVTGRIYGVPRTNGSQGNAFLMMCLECWHKRKP